MVSFFSGVESSYFLERVADKVLFGGIDKDRKLAEVTAECKALKLAERLREKAVEEVSYCSLSVWRLHMLRLVAPSVGSVG